MQNDRISELARTLGISASTVSKAVNHCAGVGSELRERILTEAEKTMVTSKKSADGSVYVILPEIPSYFWKKVSKALNGALSARNIHAKFNLYSGLGDAFPVERYLDEAEALSARVVIVAAKYPGLDVRLEELAATRAVFSFLEETAAKNVFYFGSDRHADSRALGKAVAEAHPEVERVLAVGNDEVRLAGLQVGLGEKQMIPLSQSRARQAWEPAREIYDIYGKTPFGAVICLDGNTPRTAAALKKCGLALPLYGFESPPPDARYSAPAGEMCQDISATAERVAAATEQFLHLSLLPDTKRTLIPSTLKGME